MDENDTVTGGEALTVEQAAAAYAKQTSKGAGNGQPEEDEVEQGEQADDELQASDPDEGEDDGEPDDEGQAGEEVDEEPESDQGRFVAANGKVRLPDGSVSTVSDLIQGNLRDRDYRQKTMRLADETRQNQEQSSALKASEQQVNEQRAYVAQLMESLAPQPPDPEMIRSGSPKYDPIAYMEAKDQYERWGAHLNHLHQQMESTRQGNAAETQKKRVEKATSEWGRLQDALPELKDQAKAKAFADEIKVAAENAGFSLQEIQETLPYDHRMALVLRKAAKWDKLQASKPKVQAKVEGRPPVQRGGKRLSPEAHKAQHATDAMKRLKQTGSHQDAVTAYLASRKG